MRIMASASAQGLVQGGQSEEQEQSTAEPIEHTLLQMGTDPAARPHREPGLQPLAEQAAGQQSQKSEGGRRGQEDGGELGAISLLGDELE